MTSTSGHAGVPADGRPHIRVTEPIAEAQEPARQPGRRPASAWPKPGRRAAPPATTWPATWPPSETARSRQALEDVIAGLDVTAPQVLIGAPAEVAVTALFDAWSDKTPQRRTRREALAADNALKRAARNDWPCPAGLDDELDQPGYQLQCGWRHAGGTGIADDYPLAERKAAS